VVAISCLACTRSAKPSICRQSVGPLSMHLDLAVSPVGEGTEPDASGDDDVDCRIGDRYIKDGHGLSV
jgi:hypothetical protein